MSNDNAWIYRELPKEFFKRAGHLSPEENKKAFDEIPINMKQLAFAMISMATKSKLHRCQDYRQLMFILYKDLQEKRGIDLKLPHYWYMDGVMIEPETIVRITNGIIGWVCDDSNEECGLQEECIYYDEEA